MIAELIPPISSGGSSKTVLPVVTRDAKDDYLLAYALVGQADYLVTGDEDLLVLQEIEGLKIVNPTQFREYPRPIGKLPDPLGLTQFSVSTGCPVL